MNISLTPELESFIKKKVACGLYTSASEVVRESLRLMHTYDDVQKQRLSEIRKSIDAGMAQVSHEEYVDGKESREKSHKKGGRQALGQQKSAGQEEGRRPPGRAPKVGVPK